MPQFPPLFEYKKLKDGNYTYGGLLNDITIGVEEYFGLRFKYVNIYKCTYSCKKNYFCENRVKYIIVNQAEVSEFGLITALLRMLDKKVVKLFKRPYYS